MTDTLVAPTTTDSSYDGFELMPIGDAWRHGRSTNTAIDTDPWNGETLLEIVQANRADLDDAMTRAQAAQRSWASRTAAERASVMRSAAVIMQSRRAEIVRWLIKEGGGTVAKSEAEWGAVLNGFHEAASLPQHVEGRITTSAVPGKESRVYRLPVGVVVISPWNFPMYVSNRSVAPALAVNNSVVFNRPATPQSPEDCCSPRSTKKPGYPRACSTSSSGPVTRSATPSSSNPYPESSRSQDRHQ